MSAPCKPARLRPTPGLPSLIMLWDPCTPPMSHRTPPPGSPPSRTRRRALCPQPGLLSPGLLRTRRPCAPLHLSHSLPAPSQPGEGERGPHPWKHLPSHRCRDKVRAQTPRVGGAPAVSVLCSGDPALRRVGSGAPSLGKGLPPADRVPRCTGPAQRLGGCKGDAWRGEPPAPDLPEQKAGLSPDRGTQSCRA